MHLKMHMVVHLLVQKNMQNNSTKGELEEAPHVALQGAPKILRSTIRCKKKVKKKMHLTLQVMVHLTVQTKLCLT